MAEIFISYARADRDLAALLAGALQNEGLSVWWDPRLAAGDAFDETIEHELEMSRSAVVIWTANSIGRHWVRNEARFARRLGKLAPVLLDAITPPLEFSDVHAEDLTGWSGDRDDPRFRHFVHALRYRIVTTKESPTEDHPVPVAKPWAADRNLRQRGFSLAAGTGTAMLAWFTHWLQIDPPWPANFWVITAVISAMFSIALIWMVPPLNPHWIRGIFVGSFSLTIIITAAYLIAFERFTFKIPTTQEFIITGCGYTDDARSVAQHMGIDAQDNCPGNFEPLLQAAQYEPQRIWNKNSIRTNRFVLAALWIAAFCSLALSLGSLISAGSIKSANI